MASASALGDASPEASADAEAVPCSETWGEALEDLFEEACADAETLADAEAGEELSELASAQDQGGYRNGTQGAQKAGPGGVLEEH